MSSDKKKITTVAYKEIVTNWYFMDTSSLYEALSYSVYLSVYKIEPLFFPTNYGGKRIADKAV